MVKIVGVRVPPPAPDPVGRVLRRRRGNCRARPRCGGLRGNWKVETHAGHRNIVQGLKREYKVVLPAQDLASRLDTQLNDLRGKARLNGFRPGKVPVAHLRRLYGKSIMADVVQEAVNEANRKIVEDNDLRLATEPKLDFPEEGKKFADVIEKGGRPRLHGRARGAAEVRGRFVRRHRVRAAAC